MREDLRYVPGQPVDDSAIPGCPGFPKAALDAADRLTEDGWHVETSLSWGSRALVERCYFARIMAWRGEVSLRADWTRDAKDGLLLTPKGRWRLDGRPRFARRHPDQPVEDFQARLPRKEREDWMWWPDTLSTLLTLATCDQDTLLGALNPEARS